MTARQIFEQMQAGGKAAGDPYFRDATDVEQEHEPRSRAVSGSVTTNVEEEAKAVAAAERDLLARGGVHTLTAKQLKAALRRRGLHIDDCFDKESLETRLQTALEEEAS